MEKVTVNKLIEWCKSKGISLDTPLCIERGIDLIDYVEFMVADETAIVLYGDSYEDNIA